LARDPCSVAAATNVLSVRKRSGSGKCLSVRKRSGSNKAPSRNGNQSHVMVMSHFLQTNHLVTDSYTTIHLYHNGDEFFCTFQRKVDHSFHLVIATIFYV